MYNTNFKVKYNDIENELLNKFKMNPEPETEFSEEDVLDVCDKLYRDELMSVFYIDDDVYENIDIGINYILEKLIENNDFKNMLETLKTTYFLNEHIAKDELSEEDLIISKRHALEYVFLFLFSKPLFYLTHKCICQHLTSNTIENDILKDLKEKFTSILCNK
jgi:hypothetical protein